MKNESSMTLLTDWSPDVDPTGWLMTEKYRGCRAFWDGIQLWTREGNPIPAPSAFTGQLPEGIALDGEIWAGREPIETKARLAVQYGGEHWTTDIRFVVFDCPRATGTWLARMRVAQVVCPASDSVLHARHRTCQGVGQLRDELALLVMAGGEGIVLRHPTATGYETGRSRNALRVTPLLLNIL